MDPRTEQTAHPGREARKTLQDVLLTIAPARSAIADFCVLWQAGALLSTPADAVVTELATGKHGSDWTKALAAITGAEGEAEAAGPGLAAVPRLFAGAAQRCLLFAVIITVQLLLFDFCRDKLQVSPENLSLSLDVFADRLSFYEY